MQLAKTMEIPCDNLSRNVWDFREPWSLYVPPKRDVFIHFGANVKARQSVETPRPFVHDNIIGTFNVLELARQMNPGLFVYISSAEALGGCEKGYLGIDSPMRPSNPYAASKAAGELLTHTYFRSYGLPAIIVRTQCVWSMDQTDPTKAVPIMKETLLSGKELKIYTRNGVIGSRQWIEVDEFCARLMNLLPKAIPGLIYHIVGEELNNLEMAKIIAKKLGIKQFFSEPQEISPTHELRYALTGTKE